MLSASTSHLAFTESPPTAWDEKVDTAYNVLFCDISKWASGSTEAGQAAHLPSGPLLHMPVDKEENHKLTFLRIF